MAPSGVRLCSILGILVGFVGLSLSGSTPFWHLLSVPDIDRYILPILMFDDNGLEPHIEESTVIAHHEGHVENYRKKMNNALKQWKTADPKGKWPKKNLIEIVRNLDITPTVLRYDLTSNVGGYVNHVFYWSALSGNPEEDERLPTGKLLDDINREFGSFNKMKMRFTDKALGLFGSGYVWLCRARSNTDGLIIRTTVNQDSPIVYNLNPILVLDVWEHAYYLTHQFRRAAYVADWWMLVDWELVSELDQWWAAYDIKQMALDKAEVEAEKEAKDEKFLDKLKFKEDDVPAEEAAESPPAPSTEKTEAKQDTPDAEESTDSQATPSGGKTGTKHGIEDFDNDIDELMKQVEELEKLARGAKEEL